CIPTRPTYTNSPPFPYTTLFRSLWMHPMDNSKKLGISSAVLDFEPGTQDAKVDRKAVPNASAPSSRKIDEPKVTEIPEAVIKKLDRKSTRLNSSHVAISYAVFCL